MGNKIFEILKFVFFILLLPVVVASTIGFVQGLGALSKETIEFLLYGIVVYLFIHVFIYEPQPVYQYGQNLVTVIFRFFSPLVKVASFLFPIYTILLLIISYFVGLIFKSKDLGNYFMFTISATFTMHMVFTAKILRDKDSNIIKPNYFFAISLIYVINIFILAMMFNLILGEFSFIKFFSTATTLAGNVYRAVFKQLFVP